MRFATNALNPSLSLHFWRRLFIMLLVTVFFCQYAGSMSFASDHGDRHIGDFYAFKSQGQLVLVMTIADEIPEHHEEYRFSSEAIYRFAIDNNSTVLPSRKKKPRDYGGKIVDPSGISEDIVIEVRFPNGDNVAQMQVSGLKMRSGTSSSSVVLFTGVRDDPFIRRPVAGKNIAAIVVQLPLHSVLADDHHQTLLLWATTHDADGSMHDLCGGPYRSQQPGNEKLNTTHPSEHMSKLKMPPDVLIYNHTRAVKFPNGRSLEDDVVDILKLQNKLPNELPSPDENDVAFLPRFPYLAPPHDKEHEQFEKMAPKEHIGMLRQEIGRIDLGRELKGIEGRDVRLRYWLMDPGGVIRFHQHSRRPAIVYLLSGRVEEYKFGVEGKVDISAGEMTREAADTEHYWLNKGTVAVQMAAIDLVDSFDPNEQIEDEPEPQPFPKKNYDISAGEKEARKKYKIPLFRYEDLPDKKKSLIALRDSVPESPLAHNYVMRGREITLKSGEMLPLQNHQDRPGLTYVCQGVVIEYRDDRERAVPLRAGNHTFNTNGVSRWLLNTTGEDAVIFEVDFLDIETYRAPDVPQSVTKTIPMQKPVFTAAMVEKVRLAALKEIERNIASGGCIAIVDDGGHLIVLHRTEGTMAVTPPIAEGKARTAALFRTPTARFEQIVNSGRASMLKIEGFLPMQGAVPIWFNDQVIGAIGVAGAGSAQRDEEIAIMGAKAIDGYKP